MTNKKLLEKLKEDMEMRVFLYYAKDSYYRKAKEIAVRKTNLAQPKGMLRLSVSTIEIKYQENTNIDKNSFYDNNKEIICLIIHLNLLIIVIRKQIY